MHSGTKCISNGLEGKCTGAEVNHILIPYAKRERSRPLLGFMKDNAGGLWNYYPILCIHKYRLNSKNIYYPLNIGCSGQAARVTRFYRKEKDAQYDTLSRFYEQQKIRNCHTGSLFSHFDTFKHIILGECHLLPGALDTYCPHCYHHPDHYLSLHHPLIGSTLFQVEESPRRTISISKKTYVENIYYYIY